MFIGIFSPKKDPGSLSQLADNIPNPKLARPNKKTTLKLQLLRRWHFSNISGHDNVANNKNRHSQYRRFAVKNILAILSATYLGIPLVDLLGAVTVLDVFSRLANRFIRIIFFLY